MRSSDASLLEAVRQSGDRAAYAELYERHVDAARAAAYRIAPRLDRDDVVAEAFTRILQALSNGSGPTEAFRPYLYQVIRRVTIDSMTSSVSQNEITLEEMDPVSPQSLHDLADVISDQNEVTEALGRMPERWRAVLWYTEVEGFAPREAAVMLGLSANNVAQIRRRARERFRDLITGEVPSITSKVRDRALGRKIAVAVLGLPTAGLLLPLFDGRTAATAATPSAAVLGGLSGKKALLIGGGLLAAILAGGVFLPPLFQHDDSPSTGPTTTEVRTPPAVETPSPTPTAKPKPKPEPNAPEQDREPGGVPETVPVDPPTPGVDEQPTPVDPGPWTTIEPQKPVIRGPVG